MPINRRKLIRMHNPKLKEVDKLSPFTVGNGDFGFTADVTGFQSLYTVYKDTLPLCTMAGWGWHSTPVNQVRKKYELSDIEMTRYPYEGRTVSYPKEKRPGNEKVYDWLRQNPHRMNMARIAMVYQDKKVEVSSLTDIDQELDLYQGILYSNYSLEGKPVKVQTAAAFEDAGVGFFIAAKKTVLENLSFEISFPYGASNITASDWSDQEANKTQVLKQSDRKIVLARTLDDCQYWVTLSADFSALFELKKNYLIIKPSHKSSNEKIGFSVTFSRKEGDFGNENVREIFASSKSGWEKYWKEGGMIKLHDSQDERAWELERRILLSQYLLIVNSCGSRPPQETGMTCNSWYGKCHLEMYLWHCAWLALWGHEERLLKSAKWYLNHLKQAKENAMRNGYAGARWPKMVSDDAIDAPSPIAPLLIWQQPHIIYMLEMVYQARPSRELLSEFWPVVKETAVFMEDFSVYNKKKDVYELLPPMIPVQECYQPEEVKNPVFELEYWHFVLKLAARWAERLGKTDISQKWKEISRKMAMPNQYGGCYQAHDGCNTTYEQVNEDHPSMAGALGLLPGKRLDIDTMRASLNKILACWQFKTLWGWDFAMMAMTAVRLFEPKMAVDILLYETEKNSYAINGNNVQKTRKDLPLYLPGNGALLLAIPLMCAGYEGSLEELPGFPKDGSWKVEYEGIRPFFA